MSFVIEEGHVVLLYGKQDCDAWVARIELQGLLKSLVPVATKVEINSYYSAHPRSQGQGQSQSSHAGGGHHHHRTNGQSLLFSPTGSVQ